jgi:nucleoid-associated protein EbfC
MRGMGNMQGMMKQMQKMQKKMAEAQEQLGEERLEGAAGGGMVKVIVSGDKQVIDVVIDPSVVDPEDVEMLQDLVVIATNEAMAKAEELTNSTMGQFTKGLNLPGMF